MRAELMRYRNDTLSYLLTLAGLALDACFLMFLYSSPNVRCEDMYGKIVGLDIFFNIIFLLIAFLTAEKVKTYSLNWCWSCLVLGLLQLPRILLPISLFGAKQLTVGKLIFLLVCLIGSCACLVCACVFSYLKSHKLDKHLKEISNKGE
ncbi:MAG: hypothetical protein IJF75_00130 [Clostridia bacterium]|nr:hypothetical protein [Clostridia bacterium]